MISQSTNVFVITIHGEIIDRIGKCYNGQTTNTTKIGSSLI